MKVHVIGGGMAYVNMFRELGYEPVKHFHEADLFCFTGGADVSPHLYGAKKHDTTLTDVVRDKAEEALFKHALEKKIPMVGICRGGQFLNVMCGGEMYQHVGKHATGGLHEITDLQTGETVLVTSTHHQMMKPSKKGLLVASSTLGGYREWYEGDVFKKDISKEDIEVVFYEEEKCLCFQPHPEFSGYSQMRNYFAGLLEKYLVKEVAHVS